jgi:hypothetical protein
MAGPVYDPRAQATGAYARTAPADQTGQPVIDTVRLWGGGLATAAVAGLMATIGVVVFQLVIDVDLLTPRSRGLTQASATTIYVVSAGAGTLIATLILQILVALTPRPMSYFSWMIGLITAVFTLLPFAADAETASQVATAVTNLCVGVVILTMLPQVAYSTIRTMRP